MLMTNRSSRSVRVDYKSLSKTGEYKLLPDIGKVVNKPRIESSLQSNMDVKLMAEIDGLLFQLEESLDEFTISDDQDVKSLSNLYESIKDVRINLVKCNSELKLIQGEKYDVKCDTNIKLKLKESKEVLSNIKSQLRAEEDRLNKSELERSMKIDDDNQICQSSKVYAFTKIEEEVLKICYNLSDEYSKSFEELSRDEIILKKDSKSQLCSEFLRMKDNSCKLLELNDVLVDNKEARLDSLFNKISNVELLKNVFEENLSASICAHDLSNEKLKKSGDTKINIGKFNGSMEKGIDFFSFKSKFLKTYALYPKSLLVDLLINNHLEGYAKESVGSLTCINEIWDRLKSNFGNPELLIKYQFNKIGQMGTLYRSKSYESKKQFLQKLCNIMQDVFDIAKDHGLLGELHYGNQLSKIIVLLEYQMQSDWFKIIVDEGIGKEQRWLRLIEFMNSQLSIFQLRAIESDFEDVSINSKGSNQFSANSKFTKKDTNSNKPHGAYNMQEVCKLCNSSHPNANTEFIQCRLFLKLKPKERGNLLRKNKYCLQCINAKSKFDDPNHKCSSEWICPHAYHDRYERKLHFLLCGLHENNNLFESFKSKFLKSDWQLNIFSNIYLSINPMISHSGGSVPSVNNDVHSCEVNNSNLEEAGSPVYLLQPYSFNNCVFNLMFDSGCQTFVSRKAAVDKLPEWSREQTMNGPIIISGVGNNLCTSEYGHYSVKLPIHDGSLVKFNGVCLDVITGVLPPYPVREARKTVVDMYVKNGGNKKDIPEVPAIVGGQTDFLFGMQYNYFQPRLIFILPTGLGIYESLFCSMDGSRGCIGGPHEVFRQCERQFMDTNTVSEFRVFLENQLNLFNTGLKICLDCNSFNNLSCSDKVDSTPNHIAVFNQKSSVEESVVLLSSYKKRIFEAESCGDIIEYRCVNCRGCKDCKNGEFFEKISFKEENEQNLIDHSVFVDFSCNVSSANLPFISDPNVSLSPNLDIAKKVYFQQIKKLSRYPCLKQQVIESELKLQKAGHVDWLDNLSLDQQNTLNNSKSLYYIPWRYVQNENSLTTPVRLVFDASSTTNTGYSLNNILAKGLNSMNSLLEIMIRFRMNNYALHTDITQMYNVIKLRQEFWTYQRYLWQPNLDTNVNPSCKIIKTLIYGVKSSGNQAEFALRETARAQIDIFPDAAQSIIVDTYVDDCATGAPTESRVKKLSCDIVELLSKGGFKTKGFTISKEDPLPDLTKDGSSINVGGVKWHSKKDLLQLAINPLNFAKKQRGKKSEKGNSFKIPEVLTRRICLGKVSEIFDILGFITPIVASLKIDIRDLLNSGYEWDTPISDVEHIKWTKNFMVIEDAGCLLYPRAIIPIDAINTNIDLIGAGDASQKIAAAACYVRFMKTDGSYSCQLMLAKSKIVSNELSLPRAELMAATLSVHLCAIVSKALKQDCVKKLFVTDSEITLHWICANVKQLKLWVRSRIIEINRFSNQENWFHIESKLMPVDVATRKGAKSEDVGPHSEWFMGK